jgi:hypothetical protein
LFVIRLQPTRSGGDRGADINTLRGTSGPDFEGYAIVNRPDEGGLCGCFGGGGGSGDDNAEKIVLIKGPYCFVFNNERDPSPKYAVGAAHMKPVLHPKESQGRYVVTIETHLGDIEYELKFDKENIAKQFVDSFRQQAAIGEADEVRKVSTSFVDWTVRRGGSCVIFLRLSVVLI